MLWSKIKQTKDGEESGEGILFLIQQRTWFNWYEVIDSGCSFNLLWMVMFYCSSISAFEYWAPPQILLGEDVLQNTPHTYTFVKSENVLQSTSVPREFRSWRPTSQAQERCQDWKYPCESRHPIDGILIKPRRGTRPEPGFPHCLESGGGKTTETDYPENK